ncbi:hypothetical protein CC_1390 [Caulobacter vibrioides CB15]|uniref:Uncharacterized protein n=1 Tax=Caulobacter vibrioides (strain ATCC 19089 / CIP 103742 / CB 15) TaxID=190650 RepID=Q9A8G4_CAUVC|nr:hypothetical protein CC_1390 [Caulobacter vibrioides CB15]ATC28201.1 hypothetical protein CA607_07365 [Caulobacter vibrioides]
MQGAAPGRGLALTLSAYARGLEPPDLHAVAEINLGRPLAADQRNRAGAHGKPVACRPSRTPPISPTTKPGST